MEYSAAYELYRDDRAERFRLLAAPTVRSRSAPCGTTVCPGASVSTSSSSVTVA